MIESRRFLLVLRVIPLAAALLAPSVASAQAPACDAAEIAKQCQTHRKLFEDACSKTELSANSQVPWEERVRRYTAANGSWRAFKTVFDACPNQRDITCSSFPYWARTCDAAEAGFKSAWSYRIADAKKKIAETRAFIADAKRTDKHDRYVQVAGYIDAALPLLQEVKAQDDELATIRTGDAELSAAIAEFTAAKGELLAAAPVALTKVTVPAETSANPTVSAAIRARFPVWVANTPEVDRDLKLLVLRMAGPVRSRTQPDPDRIIGTVSYEAVDVTTVTAREPDGKRECRLHRMKWERSRKDKLPFGDWYVDTRSSEPIACENVPGSGQAQPPGAATAPSRPAARPAPKPAAKPATTSGKAKK